MDPGSIETCVDYREHTFDIPTMQRTATNAVELSLDVSLDGMRGATVRFLVIFLSSHLIKISCFLVKTELYENRSTTGSDRSGDPVFTNQNSSVGK